MMHTIRYSLLPGLERTGVLAPMLPLILINGVYSFPTVALVDSGAESGLISTVIADELHLNWRKTPKYEGFSTGGVFIFHPIPKVEVEIFGENYDFALNVVEGIYAFKCILGRRDLFRVAKIVFEGYKKQFQLEFRKLN